MGVRRAAAWATAALAAAALAGCGADGDDRAAAAAIERDSAGVRIVESGAPAWAEGEGLALDAEPLLVIGDEDGAPETQLYQVRAAFRLGDGRVALFDGGSNEVRFFGADGSFLHKVGGKGGGPGEYQFVSWVARLAGDSLLVNDLMAQRLTLLAPDGSVARAVSLASARSEPEREAPGGPGGRVTFGGLGRYEVLGPFFDGTLLARERRGGAPLGGVVTRDSLAYFRLDAEGAPIDTLGTLPGDEVQAQSSGSGENSLVMFGPPPFGRTAQVRTDGDAFYFGTGDRYEIARYSSDGRLVRLVRRPVEPLPVTPEDAAALRERELGQGLAGSDPRFASRLRQAVEQKWETAQLPERMPAHGALEVDRAGRLWVRVTTRPADLVPRYDVFDAKGRYLGAVALPEGFRVLEIGADYVLGVARDENDVEQVRLHALRMARRGA